jgi:hypothetical protein
LVPSRVANRRLLDGRFRPEVHDWRRLACILWARKLTAYITARSPGTDAEGDELLYYATAVANVPFHQRRAVRIRYERWQSMTSPSPTDGECFKALRLRAKLGES